jgi:hypothetical protein
MTTDIQTRRLFVPLANDPFRWFAEGQKRWELRKYGRQYTERNVRVGQSVELRRGYNTKQSLWGRIGETTCAANVRDFFDKVDYEVVVPDAGSKAEAIEIAEKILGIASGSEVPLFAFKVELGG